MIEEVRFDEWNDLSLSESTIRDPKYEDVSAALHRLDAKKYTMLTCVACDNSTLVVGGGSGAYIVYYSPDDLVFYILLGNESASGSIVINIGGQEGDYSQRHVIDIDCALKALKFFYTTAQMDEEQKWERQ